MALGLCLLWGYCGIVSFGQVAYFGIAGYVYGIIAGNMIGHPIGPLIGSIGGLATAALIAGSSVYFVFLCACAELERTDPDPRARCRTGAA